jgi:hypothetical protein
VFTTMSLYIGKRKKYHRNLDVKMLWSGQMNFKLDYFKKYILTINFSIENNWVLTLRLGNRKPCHCIYILTFLESVYLKHSWRSPFLMWGYLWGGICEDNNNSWQYHISSEW